MACAFACCTCVQEASGIIHLETQSINFWTTVFLITYSKNLSSLHGHEEHGGKSMDLKECPSLTW
jgi:hypothetical protein